MASSFQTRNNNFKRFNDLDLVALICLFSHEITRRSVEYPTILPAIQRWGRDLSNYGPGTIDLNLDAFPASALADSEFLSAANAIKSFVSQFGETLPAWVLNENCNIRGIKFSDFPVSNINIAIDDLSALFDN